jgi:hypothetical protein
LFLLHIGTKMATGRRGLIFGGGHLFWNYMKLFQQDKLYIRQTTAIKPGGLNTGIFIATG